MPNRILRDWTDSKAMDSLSWQAEVLFTRLIMKADDHGNFYADPALIKSLCFPRKDGLRTNDIIGWLSSLEAARLIFRYPAKGDTFLHIRNFGQRLDRQTRKFPEQPDDGNQMVSNDNQPPPETKRNEVETETKQKQETETKGGAAACQPLVFPFYSDVFLSAWNLLLNQKKWKKKSSAALQMSLKLLSKQSEEDAIKMIENAIAGEWQGLHELKNNNNGKSTFKTNGSGKGAHSDAELADALEKHYRAKQQGGTL